MNSFLADPLPTRARAVQRVVLAGFMGSGKTTVGRELARQLDWTFTDLDDAVSAAQGISVPEIFARQGEAAFRVAEVQSLRGLLRTPQQVIALGGGAPETSAIRELLQADAATLVVHLHAPANILFARCTAQASDPASTARPLLGSAEMANARLERRLPLYAAVATHQVDVSSGTPAEIASGLARWLQQATLLP